MNVLDKNQLINNITKLAEKSKISVNKALIESGVGKDFITNIRKESVPSVENVLKIAEYFNVSVDYLLGRNNKSEQYSQPDEKILSDIKKLNTDGQEYIKQQIQFALSRNNYTKS